MSVASRGVERPAPQFVVHDGNKVARGPRRFLAPFRIVGRGWPSGHHLIQVSPLGDHRQHPLPNIYDHPGPSEQTITVSHEQFISLLDAFAECAQSLQHKLILLDDLYALLRQSDEVAERKVLTQGKQQAVKQTLADLRAMRAEAER